MTIIKSNRTVAVILNLAGLALLTNVRGANSIQQELGYSREYLRDEQRKYQIQVERAATELKASQDRLTGGLPTLAERNLLLTILYVDDANIRIDGHEQRVAALRPSPLSYARDKQIRLLLATYADLQAKERRVENSAFEFLSRQPSGVTNSWRSLALYLSKRAEYRVRFKDRSLSAEDLAGDLQLLQDYPLPLVIGGLINGKNHRAWTKLNDGSWRSPGGTDFLADGRLKPAVAAQDTDNASSPNDVTSAALKSLERTTSELARAVSQLTQDQGKLVSDLSSRSEQTQNELSADARLIASNRQDAARTNSSTQKTADSIPLTNHIIEQVTQIQAPIAITQQVNTNSAPPTKAGSLMNSHTPNQAQTHSDDDHSADRTNAAVTSMLREMAASPAVNSEQAASETKSVSTEDAAIIATAVAKPRQLKLAWSIIVGASLLAIALTLGLTFARRSQCEFEMLLTCGPNGHEESITLTFDPRQQCVVLDGERPRLESQGAETNEPCIFVRSFAGPLLRPGATTELRLNGEPISKAKRLCAGDVVQVNTNDRSYNFTFQGGNFVSAEETSASFG